MASKAVIPRFLLPLRGSLWQNISARPTQQLRIQFSSPRARYSSKPGSNGGDKPIVLEKPLKFNPPSHGSRLSKNKRTLPKHYGASLTAEEVSAQKLKSYPGMMAPEGTWTHFFWHSRMLHVCITMGTLLCLGLFTFFMNYATNSPFKELLPPISDLWRQPIHFITTWKNVIVMHERDKGIRAYEHRIAHQNDVAKRRYYMKMHGIEAKDPVTMVFGKSDDKSEKELEAEALGTEMPVTEKGEEKAKERSKLFGIF